MPANAHSLQLFFKAGHDLVVAMKVGEWGVLFRLADLLSFAIFESIAPGNDGLFLNPYFSL